MLKIRLMGTKNDIKWFEKILKRQPKVAVTEVSELYRKGYEKWATLHNLKQMAATMSIYEESGFASPKELEAAFAAASAELNSVHAELKAVESTLR